jgi:hypothetical protein
LSDPYAILKVLDKQKEVNKMFAVRDFDGVVVAEFATNEEALAQVALYVESAKENWLDAFGDLEGGNFDLWDIVSI